MSLNLKLPENCSGARELSGRIFKNVYQFWINCLKRLVVRLHLNGRWSFYFDTPCCDNIVLKFQLSQLCFDWINISLFGDDFCRNNDGLQLSLTTKPLCRWLLLQWCVIDHDRLPCQCDLPYWNIAKCDNAKRGRSTALNVHTLVTHLINVWSLT